MVPSTDAFSLHGKKILITGASSGIGAAVAHLCADLGAELVITGRNGDRLEAVRAGLAGEGHVSVIGDLTESTTHDALLQSAAAFDGLVSCAGIAALVPFRMATEAHLQKMLSVNYLAPMNLTRLLLYKKMFQPGSSLVYVTALAARVSPMAASAYAASKSALDAACRTIGLEYAKQKIRANSVAPGYVDTPMLQSLGTQAGMDHKIDLTPLGRLNPVDVASAVCYLLAPASRWTTRSTLTVDGGLGIAMRV